MTGPTVNEGDTWVVILAGGSGKRVRDLTRDDSGAIVPKQFWNIDDDRTMLDWALDRAMRIARPERTIVVVASQHARWWDRRVRRLPSRNVLVQPADRGTGIAALYALMTIGARDPEAIVVMLPCDQFVRREKVLLHMIEVASLEARVSQERVVILGVVPPGYEPGYGWIVPKHPSSGRRPREVVAFVEKPDARTAMRMLRGGALVNTFILTGELNTLLEMFHRAIPRVVGTFVDWAIRTNGCYVDLDLLYRLLPICDFSRDVIQRAPELLGVLPVPASCGWADLGTPERLNAFLRSRSADRRNLRHLS